MLFVRGSWRFAARRLFLPVFHVGIWKSRSLMFSFDALSPVDILACCLALPDDLVTLSVDVDCTLAASGAGSNDAQHLVGGELQLNDSVLCSD